MQSKLLMGVIFLLTLCLQEIKAQETPVTAGGNGTGNNGSVSYSVGQVVYQTHKGTNGSVAEGVQQAYEISTVTGIEISTINLNISAFPNPTVNSLNLKIENKSELFSFSFQLYNLGGELLQNKETTGELTQIEMRSYVSATYFLRVLNETEVIKIFKIIKN